MDWIDGKDLFGFVVEKNEIPRSGGRPYAQHTKVELNLVLHTTEGPTVKNALNTFAGEPNNASHFVVGESRIIQLRSLDAQAGALAVNSPHNPNDGTIQIENVGYSKENLWLPEDGLLKPLVALLAFLGAELQIPLTVPNAWPDDCSDIKTILATNNTRRLQAEKTWPAPQGVWLHMEVPWQAKNWHWDMGRVRRSVILQQAEELANQPVNGTSPSGGSDPLSGGDGQMSKPSNI